MDALLAAFGIESALFGESTDNLGAALFLLVATTAAGVAVRVVVYMATQVFDVRDRRRKRDDVLTDIVIYARTFANNVKLVTSEAALEHLRHEIEADPLEYRAYGAAINERDLYEDYKEIRRTFSPEDMSRLDTFFDDARLFEIYYRKLESDEFANLPARRKLRVVKQFSLLGAQLSESYDRVRFGVDEFINRAHRINLDVLRPDPTVLEEAAIRQTEPSEARLN